MLQGTRLPIWQQSVVQVAQVAQVVQEYNNTVWNQSPEKRAEALSKLPSSPIWRKFQRRCQGSPETGSILRIIKTCNRLKGWNVSSYIQQTIQASNIPPHQWPYLTPCFLTPLSSSSSPSIRAPPPFLCPSLAFYHYFFLSLSQLYFPFPPHHSFTLSLPTFAFDRQPARAPAELSK